MVLWWWKSLAWSPHPSGVPGKHQVLPNNVHVEHHKNNPITWNVMPGSFYNVSIIIMQEKKKTMKPVANVCVKSKHSTIWPDLKPQVSRNPRPTMSHTVRCSQIGSLCHLIYHHQNLCISKIYKNVDLLLCTWKKIFDFFCLWVRKCLVKVCHILQILCIFVTVYLMISYCLAYLKASSHYACSLVNTPSSDSQGLSLLTSATL